VINSSSVGTLKPAGQMSLTPPSTQAAALSAPLISAPVPLPLTQSPGTLWLMISVVVATTPSMPQTMANSR
jgi:hypothetical protein